MLKGGLRFLDPARNDIFMPMTSVQVLLAALRHAVFLLAVKDFFEK